MDWLHQGPDSQMKLYQTERDKKVLILSGFFLVPKYAGNLGEVGQIVPVHSVHKRRQNLAPSGLFSSISIQTSGPRHQIEPAFFILAPSGMILSDSLGVAMELVFLEHFFFTY